MKYLVCILISISSIVFAQKVEKIGTEINSEYSEIHPLIAPDGNTLYFVRVSHPENNMGKENTNDVWYSTKKSNGKWDRARKMPNTVNKDRYNDLFSISPDGNTILIRGVYENGRKVSSEIGISVCKKTKRGWSQPQHLDIPKLGKLSKGQFLSAFLSNNGKVLILGFSEKKNSLEDDLYFSLKEKDGKWTVPESLGKDINTNSTETTPYLAADEQSLYFASDRKGGLGGTDIYITKRKGRTWTKWTTPVNLGEKINTPSNDLYYSISADGKYAYLANSQESIGKMDIVSYDLTLGRETSNLTALESSQKGRDNGNTSADINQDNGIEKDKDENKGKRDKKDGDGLEADINNLLKPTPVVVLSGKVIDSKTGLPMDAIIKYEDLDTGEELGEADTDPTNGNYKIVLPYGKRYTIRAENNDFIAFEKQIDLTREEEYKELTGEDLKLAPIEEGSSVVLNNIFFQFGKATLQAESFFELDRLVKLLKNRNRLKIEVQGHTDNVGSDENNMQLSEERAASVKTYLLANGVKEGQVQSKGFGETSPIASNDTTEGQAQNRRVEILIIQK